MDNIEALKKSREVNGGRAHLWAMVLVVGLALEVAVLLAFREGKSWVETAASVGTALLVAVSVGLEVHFGKKAEEASSELQRISEERIAELNVRAEEANLKAEQEKLARVKIEQQLAPRMISPERIDQIVERLRPLAGTEFTVGVNEDAEAYMLSMVLIGAFVRAGLVFVPWLSFPRLDTGYGFVRVSKISAGVILHCPASLREAGQQVLEALFCSGLEHITGSEDGQGWLGGRIQLEVGQKDTVTEAMLKAMQKRK